MPHNGHFISLGSWGSALGQVSCWLRGDGAAWRMQLQHLLPVPQKSSAPWPALTEAAEVVPGCPYCSRKAFTGQIWGDLARVHKASRLLISAAGSRCAPIVISHRSLWGPPNSPTFRFWLTRAHRPPSPAARPAAGALHIPSFSRAGDSSTMVSPSPTWVRARRKNR